MVGFTLNFILEIEFNDAEEGVERLHRFFRVYHLTDCLRDERHC